MDSCSSTNLWSAWCLYTLFRKREVSLPEIDGSKIWKWPSKITKWKHFLGEADNILTNVCGLVVERGCIYIVLGLLQAILYLLCHRDDCFSFICQSVSPLLQFYWPSRESENPNNLLQVQWYDRFQLDCIHWIFLLLAVSTFSVLAQFFLRYCWDICYTPWNYVVDTEHLCHILESTVSISFKRLRQD